MKDLQKLSPEIVTINKSFEMEGAEMDKVHRELKQSFELHNKHSYIKEKNCS